MRRKKPNRKKATQYLDVIDALYAAEVEAGIPRTVTCELVGIEYITLDKYMRKERNVREEEIVRRMVVVTGLLTELIQAGKLPISPDVNLRMRRTVIFETIDAHIQAK